MKAYIFPGQGAQIKGMGAMLFDLYPEITMQANEILGYDIKHLCMEDPDSKLSKTQYTQPALYTVGALSYMQHQEKGGAQPDYFAGHSLGEYNALLAAESFDFVTGLKLVMKRGELMANAFGGSMAAILGMKKEELQRFLRDHELHAIDLANFNTASQIVISGMSEDIKRACSLLENDGRMCIPLNTSGAFHSRYMESAKNEFADYVNSIAIFDPKIPVVANISALPYAKDSVKSNLLNQITGSVQWNETILFLLRKGVSEFKEFGSGEVLTRLISAIQREKPHVIVSEAENLSSNTNTQELSDAAKKQLLDEKPELHQLNEWHLMRHEKTSAEKVELWNSKYPIGTSANSSAFPLEIFKTRTRAMILFGHRAAVYMDGYNGYFDLDEVSPVN